MAKKNVSSATRNAGTRPPAAKPAASVAAPVQRDYTKLIMYLLIGLLLVGFVLRIIKLDGLSLWVDEYVHVIRARDVANGEGKLFTDDNNGILYTLFIIPLFKIFGASAFLGRLPSVLLGTGVIWMTWLLGKAMYNRYVGLLAATLCTFSLYEIYWSRLARNYAIFAFFFLVLIYVFWRAWETEKTQGEGNLLKRWGISLPYLLLLPVALLLSLLSHQLTFLFVFAVGAYFFFKAIAEAISTRSFPHKYMWIGGFAGIFLVLLLTPSFAGFTASVLSAFLPPNAVNMIVLDWDRLGDLWKKEPYEAWNTYYGVLKYDLRAWHYVGIAGFILAFILSKRASLFLLCMFVVPFLMMSFIFREPTLPRYIFYIYPLFLIAIAAGIGGLMQLLKTRVFKSRVPVLLSALPFLLVIASTRFSELKQLVNVENKNGFVVDKALSQWSFTNWKDPVEWVKKSIQPGDIVISTVPIATSYYVGLQPDSVVWFRQREYDGVKKTYVPYPVKGDGHNAHTLEDLQQTMAQNPRGWLIADYYLYNVMTDPKTRDFVFGNMHFHPEACKDGSVQVFSWDRAQGPPQNQNTIMELGKLEQRGASDELSFNVTPAFLRPGLRIALRAKDINYNNEAYVIINKNYTIPIPANQGTGIEDLSVPLDISKLKQGQNTIQFAYNPELKYDPAKGFVIYNVLFGQ